ncbi:hypothetical protein FOC4_g10001789 [Fusarium odoratissimum]|uniref:Uncharacterized protein n=2 Tax=Fusarium oxysporum species complex TaxID=171631 RepID=N1S2N7_FUSC4|nr:hypothetical protein FOC4_g10001789 [Fusarium odoratissimum]
MDLMVWRANTEQEKLWENVKKPTAEEVKTFRSLIEEIRIHHFQKGHGTIYQDHRGCWHQVKHPKNTNQLNPGKRLGHRLIRSKSTLLPPPSIERERPVGEWCAYYA